MKGSIMHNLDIAINSLLKRGYLGIDDYIEKASNEILFDEVWVWRQKIGLEENISLPCQDNLFIKIFSQILLKIIEKGGVMVDYSDGEAAKIIAQNHSNPPSILVEKIIDFMKDNPNYGSDGNGIWFE